MNELTINEINRLHKDIINALSGTVINAIKIGDILNNIKTKTEHGDFLFWIKDNCEFSERTAYNYMKISEYKQNCTACANLQEAYKQIESIEAIQKRRESERKQELIKERIKTGIKPEGWDRSLDYEYKKRIDFGGYAKIKDDLEFKKPKEKIKENTDFNVLEQATDLFLQKHNKISEFKDKIRLSDMGKQDPFVDAIMDYLSELENDTRRIEACNNIIKVCKTISIDLQSKNA